MSGVAATVLVIVAVIVGIIGVAIPYWEHGSYLGLEIHSGLWKACGRYDNIFVRTSRICIDIPEISISDSLKAVRALEILGIIFLGLSLVSGIFKLAVRKDKVAFFWLAGGLAIFSGVLMITGAIIYGVKTQHEIDPGDMLHLHAGFGLCITAGCLAIIAGSLYLCDRTRYPDGPSQQIQVPHQVAYSTGYSVGSPGIIIAAPSNAYAPPVYPQYTAPPSYSAGNTDYKIPPTY